MIIDFHAHFNSGDPAEVKAFVANCEKNNCRAAMSGGLHYGGHDFLPNDQVIDYCNEYKDVLIPLVKLDLWDKPVDLDELHRLVDRGAKGVKCIYPYYEYDHDLYMPLYEECEKLGLPILFHTGNYRPNEEDMRSRRPILKNMNPINLDRPARSFQKLKIVIAHLGTTFWRVQAAEMIKMHDNVYADLAGSGSWMGLSANELAQLLAPWVILCRDNAKHFKKLVFGSDCYVKIPSIQTDGKLHYEQILRKVGADQETRDAVMGGTVASWLGL
ncbi:MAG: amidohydrolase family protein [Lentisphaeria bacterium]|nr:amidohydrolase family protein [Lentisphaeria bacterium]